MDTLSRPARTYIVGVVMAGAVLLAWQLPLLTRDRGVWLIVIGLCATLGQLLNVEGSTVRSNYNAGLVAYGFALLALGFPAALLVMLVACIVDWAWHRYQWYVQTFNIAVMAASLAGAEFIRSGITLAFGPGLPVQVLGALAASLVFVAGNHLGVGAVIRLARRESLRESGIFGRLPLVIDSALFSLGALTGVLWSTSQFVILLAIVPLYPIYLSLRVPSLERKVIVDSKTGLFNTEHFNKELARELERAHRFDRPLTVVLGDLDLLRNINNTFGHLAGDVVLISVAAILRESVREYDVVARFGGEEFSILMPETSPEDAATHIDAIRARIADSGFQVSTSVDPIKATMSFGIAGREGPGQSATQLMHQADLAVYRAKLQGRNRVCVSEGTDEDFIPFLSSPVETSPDASSGDDDSTRVTAVDASQLHEVLTELPAEFPTATQSPSAVDQDHHRAPPKAKRPPLSSRAIHARLALTAAIATGSFLAVLLLMPRFSVLGPFLQPSRGLLMFAILAVASELWAVEIYARDTSVSTSATVLVAGAAIFGPVGALTLGVLVAGAALIRNHSAASRFLFNLSTHSVAGLLAVGATMAIAPPPDTYGHWRWAAACVISALLYFTLTTCFVAWAISWTGGTRTRTVWNERFRWLAPYYVGLGLAAYGLLFGYLVAGPLGLLVVVTPLLVLRLGQAQYVNRTRTVVSELRKTNEQLTWRAQEITQLSEELLLVVAAAVDARDPYVVDHSTLVSRYSILIAQRLGLSGHRLEVVRKASLLHDIGKLGVPESILFKPGRLSGAEYLTVKGHCAEGARILSGCGTLNDVTPIVLHHHERYDGRGYPHGLKESEIPLEARIIALADSVEAMASDRPYRQGMEPEEILDEIRACTGTQFDPTVAAAFLAVVESRGLDLIVNCGRLQAAPADWAEAPAS